MPSDSRKILSSKCGRRYSKPKLSCYQSPLKKDLVGAKTFHCLEKAKSEPNSPISLKRSLKRPTSTSCTPEKNSNRFHYEPQIFLRCHSRTNDCQDYKTQVWAASFEPDLSNENKTTDLVATCGGNSVCFINCRTGHVLKKYKSDILTENLFTLDWTVLRVNENSSNKTSIVATGGHEKKIYLIHPSQLKCYLKIKAHTADINCLKFHPFEKTWLFSGSSDKFIYLWDIGCFSLPTYKASHKKLMTLEAHSEVIQLSICHEYNCLFAASQNGLKAWSIDDRPEMRTKQNAVNLLIPESCAANDTNLVDGLTLISPNYLGLKVSHSGKVFISKISDLFEKGKLKKRKSFQLPATVVFLWSDSNSDYNYMNSSLDGGVMACGDNAGSLWIYDTQKYISSTNFEEADELQLPSMMLQWPHLTFDGEDMLVRAGVIVNSVAFNWNGEYLVACTDSNLLCLWKKKSEELIE